MNIKTKKSDLIEKTYINLVDCYEEIKFSDLTFFEQDRAEKLINFCRIVFEEFKDDERFTEINNNNQDHV